MILSIIIPVYNVETYVEKCLLSCIRQDISHDDYEIIVINDGSIDNSLRIVEDVASRFENIKIYSQSNSGLSVARNVGLQHARGQYIWFIDSDDWIENNCLKDIFKCLHSKELDILQLQYREFYDDIKFNKDFYCKVEGVRSGMELMSEGGLLIPAPFAIYRKSLLDENKLNFYPGIFHEDCDFKPKVLFFAEKCASLDVVVYNYYQRAGGSITTTVNPKHAFDYLKVAISIHDFYTNIAQGACASYFHNYISMIINNALFTVANKEEEFSRELYKHRYLFKHLLKSRRMKYKVEGILFTMFPGSTVSIYKLLKR